MRSEKEGKEGEERKDLSFIKPLQEAVPSSSPSQRKKRGVLLIPVLGRKEKKEKVKVRSFGGEGSPSVLYPQEIGSIKEKAKWVNPSAQERKRKKRAISGAVPLLRRRVRKKE